VSLNHEWRTYCSDGGYVGQGGGEDRVILLGNYWVEFNDPTQVAVDRLVKSVHVRVTPTAR
jgi:hypothetical protein